MFLAKDWCSITATPSARSLDLHAFATQHPSTHILQAPIIDLSKFLWTTANFQTCPAKLFFTKQLQMCSMFTSGHLLGDFFFSDVFWSPKTKHPNFKAFLSHRPGARCLRSSPRCQWLCPARCSRTRAIPRDDVDDFHRHIGWWLPSPEAFRVVVSEWIL